jgi:hypothetical protein
MGAACDDWDASHASVRGKLQLTAACRDRVVLIPIIDHWPNGNGPVTLLGFAQMYLAGYDPSDGKTIRAVLRDDSYAHPDVVLGAYDSYGTKVVRLTE